MSLYELFGLSANANAFDIETAGKSALRTINPTTVKQFIINNNLPYTDEEISTLINNMKKHIDSSASLLLDPPTKDCYDAVLAASTRPQQTLAKARVDYLNSQKGAVVFDDSVYQLLPLACKEAKVVGSLKTESKPKPLSCRWCKKEFSLSNYKIYQCKCTARIGHKQCADDFEMEYAGRCPVCRTNLLARYEISKYMFWSIESKFKM
tara:strand:- start:162 stop:785 length:624 start_codon:yes stop_codon:yes gene_type:complete